MATEYVALLRAISNTPMDSFRRGMEALGFEDVESFGMSGNLLFNSKERDTRLLEERIGAEFGTPAFIRRRAEIGRILASDPHGSSIMFLSRAPTRAGRRRLSECDLHPPHPKLWGRNLFFVYPVRVRGRRSPMDLEQVLGRKGTARSARVVARLAEKMS